MARGGKLDLEKIRASLDTPCPHRGQSRRRIRQRRSCNFTNSWFAVAAQRKHSRRRGKLPKLLSAGGENVRRAGAFQEEEPEVVELSVDEQAQQKYVPSLRITLTR